MAWQDALDGTVIKVAELFQFTLSDGTILRYTSHEQDIIFQANNYVAIPIIRTTQRKDSGVATGEVKITIPRHDNYIDTTKLYGRYLDNGQIQITWIERDNHTNYRVNFVGITGDVSYSESRLEITFKNLLNLFRKKIPVGMYNESCRHRMYDAGCKLVKATWKVTGSADAGSTDLLVVDAGRLEADKYFNLGYIEMTSGNNNGAKRLVRVYTTGNIQVMTNFDSAIQAGDNYDMYPHCRKTYDICDSVYSNADNYGGFQDIPDPVDTFS